jgi:hypothetical protein
MMDYYPGEGRWKHDVLRFTILSLGYFDFVQTGNQIAGAIMHRLSHAAYRIIKRDSQNLHGRFFLWNTPQFN